MDRVEIVRVQQVSDLAFFRQGQRWIDSRLIPADEKAPRPEPDITIDFGSDER